MLYRFKHKKSILVLIIFVFSSFISYSNIAFAKKEDLSGKVEEKGRKKDNKLLNKYEKWKMAVTYPQNAALVFSFFYNNPHWPLFEESIKIAENNITNSVSDSMILTWFKRYPPKTGAGLKAYMKRLIAINPKIGAEYIKQTWIFQNLAPDFMADYKSTFLDYITDVEDAKKAKRLTQLRQIDKLTALKKIVNSDISNYISDFLKKHFVKKIFGFSQENLNDIDQKYNIIQNLIDKNENIKAASILSLSNNNEEKYAASFFYQRRHVAFNVLRSGDPQLAYDVMSLYKLPENTQKNEKIAKAEWLLGYISYRFFMDFAKAEYHFKKAYENSNNSIRISKNAFWLAEVYYHRGDIILALDYYRKAGRYFSTFYGYLAKERINVISKKYFSVISNVENEDLIQSNKEIVFYNRELVQVLLKIPDRSMSKYFYKQLINEIDDPEEEALLINLATANDEISMLIEENSKRQHYFSNAKAYKSLTSSDIECIRRINPNGCFLALIHAIIQRESNFNEKAKSSAGAIGLMQIMPLTAKYEARKLRFHTSGSLFGRRKNITIGASIINRLLKKYNENLVFVIAAYNCGEGNLAKFQRSIINLKNLRLLDLMELIPIKETRIYVKHVIRALFTYQKKFFVENCYNCNEIQNNGKK